MDLEQIGYFLFMEDQEKRYNENRSMNEETITTPSEPHQNEKDE